jgi:hypothetical protein
VNEASRRSQIRAAVEAGRQTELEKAVEQAAARQHQAAPGPGNEKSAAEVRDPDLGQGPLTHKDPVLNKNVTEVIEKAVSGAIAAAAEWHVPYTGLPDTVIDAVERSGFGQYPFSRTNFEVGLRMAIEDAKEHVQKAGQTLHVAEVKEKVERFRSRMEDARYPAQRDERGLGPRQQEGGARDGRSPVPVRHESEVRRRDRPLEAEHDADAVFRLADLEDSSMARCCFGHDVPEVRNYQVMQKAVQERPGKRPAQPSKVLDKGQACPEHLELAGTAKYGRRQDERLAAAQRFRETSAKNDHTAAVEKSFELDKPAGNSYDHASRISQTVRQPRQRDDRDNIERGFGRHR